MKGSIQWPLPIKVINTVTSHEYLRLNMKNNFKKSMSRVSRCLDNQPIERFLGTFKAESFYLRKHDTYDDVLKDVLAYIRYYNHDRYTERLNGLSPHEYRQAASWKIPQF